MKLVVTGGAGFIGSHFIRRMLKASHEIINIDALTYAGNLSNTRDFLAYGSYSFIKANINNPARYAHLADADAVVNFAAETHVDRSIAAPAAFIKSNVLGVSALLEFCLRRRCTFLQVSTDEVYGTLGTLGKFSESSPLNPRSPYSASKAGADMLALAYNNTYGLDVRITRCTNNYGPNQHPEKLIPHMLALACANKPLGVYGDGSNVREWLYVEDHCTAIETVLLSGAPGEVYNVGNGNEMTNLELVKLLLKKLGRDESLITFVPDRPGHDFRYAIDASKLRALGWRPETPFDEGLGKTLEWYLANQKWVRAALKRS